MRKQDETKPAADAGPVERGVRPLCYMAKAVAAKLKAKAPEVAPNYGATTTVSIARAFKDDAPLYDQAALDAAVAEERKHWRTLLSRGHVFKGSCPDATNWHDRDPECPACRALGEWRA